MDKKDIGFGLAILLLVLICVGVVASVFRKQENFILPDFGKLVPKITMPTLRKSGIRTDILLKEYLIKYTKNKNEAETNFEADGIENEFWGINPRFDKNQWYTWLRRVLKEMCPGSNFTELVKRFNVFKKNYKTTIGIVLKKDMIRNKSENANLEMSDFTGIDLIIQMIMMRLNENEKDELLCSFILTVLPPNMFEYDEKQNIIVLKGESIKRAGGKEVMTMKEFLQEITKRGKDFQQSIKITSNDIINYRFC